ncbi:hypothetical protein DPX16_16742 [Anabarilius grahami]|uniref:THAP-type domain-containing protein n=1 Tax=Anabarilius grahami TaxID=495550 RepID=A0A3N0YSE0_ANAGA|nr:hypothetical protein DPX16_16742 [Anabarilius grahami]
MGCKCLLARCKNLTGWHWFPRDADRARLWLQAVGSPSTLNTSRLFVCNKHFSRESFYRHEDFGIANGGNLRREDTEQSLKYLSIPTGQPQKEKLNDHEKRISETENRISMVEDAAAPVEGKLDFFESWLPNSLGSQTKLGLMKVERAHHVPGGPVKTVSPYLRAVLVRFHNYVDKLRVIIAARALGNREQSLMFGNSKVKIFQDFSAAILCKHKLFNEVKKHLRAAGADLCGTYAQLYPATLKVTHPGATNVFQDPSEVDKT